MESSCISKYSGQERPKKSSPTTQYSILNQNVNENDDNDDDYKFFRNKKNREEIWVLKFGEIRVFGQNIYEC